MGVNANIVTMTIWTPDIENRSGPRYAVIADAISDAIAEDDLPVGAKLPPQRDLAWRLGVTVGTVSRAYKLAHERGLVGGEVGRGTYVLDGPPDREEILPDIDQSVVNLARNVPARDIHVDPLADVLHRIADSPGREKLLGYMPSSGHMTYRQAGADWMSRAGLEADAEYVLMFNGAQEVFTAAIASLVGVGGTILTESLTFNGICHAAALFNANLVGVAMDDEGLLPDELDAACRSSDAKVLITVPMAQNPTTAFMGEDRRRAIVEVARTHDLIIIEDDVYGYITESRPPAIAQLAPERTLYMTSLSKSVAPGLRIAWAFGPADIMAKLGHTLYGLRVSQPALTAEIAKTWIEDGTADRLRHWQTGETAAREAIAREVFAGLNLRSHPACFHAFLELPEPWRTREFETAAREQGILVVPAEDFAVDRTPVPHAVRLSLTGPASREILRHSLETLNDMVRAAPSPRRTVI